MCHQSRICPGQKEISTREDTMRVSSWGKPKIWWKRGKVAKRIVNKFSKIILINNTTPSPTIIVNGGGVADSGSTLQCYRRVTPTENYCPAAALHDVQQNGSQIVSTMQAILYKEARKRYKPHPLTQNLVSLSVLADNRWTITLDRTSIKVTKGDKQVMEGYREHQTRLWRLKLEDTQK